MSMRPVVAFFTSVAVVAVLAVAAGLLGFLGSMLLALVALALGAVGLVGALFTGMFFIDALAAGDSDSRTRSTMAAFLGLMVGVLIFLPVMWGSQAGTAYLKRPIRAVLAERVIERTRAAGLTGSEDIRLKGIKRLLSDDGAITVYADGDTVAVWFWDFRGILDSFNASVYVSDASGNNIPTALEAEYGVQHVSGHWWKSVPD